jgi:hypothetical protein
MEVNEKPILKSETVLLFYIVRIPLLSIPTLLYVFNANYLLILISLVYILPMLLDAFYIAIEVYPDHFELTRVGLLYKNLKEVEKYYYKDMSDFVYKKGLSYITALFMSDRYGSIINPKFSFDYKEMGETFEIKIKINPFQNNLANAFQLISENVKS